MGTSTGRRAPTSRFWRTAKRTATRYLSAADAASVTAREVVADYLLALKDRETPQPQELLAAFRLTRKVAQNLGAWGEGAASQGWLANCQEIGVGELVGQPPEILAQALAAILLEDSEGLEEAVIQTALVEVLQAVLPTQLENQQPLAADLKADYLSLDAATLVSKFLATVLFQRLVFDLGESLEAAAPGWSRYNQGLAEIRAEIQMAAEAAAREFPAPSRWQGLSGWTWVTQVMEALLQQFYSRPRSGKE